MVEGVVIGGHAFGNRSTLYCLRGPADKTQWNQKLLKTAFWSLNIGLAMMTFLSLLPQGLWQTYVSVSEGYAAARSADLLQSDLMHTLVWLRVPGDLVFSLGLGAFVLFVCQAFLKARRKVTVVGATATGDAPR